MSKDKNKIIQNEELPELENIPQDEEFNWDDFEFDFGEEFKEDRRKPVTLKNIVKETGKEFKKIPPSKIASAVEDTLPRSIKSDVQDIKDIYTSAAEEFQGYFSKIKKEAGLISQKLDQILPKEGKIRALFEKVKLQQEESGYGRGRIDYKEEEIKRSVRDAIGSEEEFENKKEAIRQSLEEKRNRETNKILESISSDVYASKVFAFDYTSRFQRKSLELQYRHLGLMKDLITLNKDLGEKQVEHLKGILVNTALPDVVKNRQMELIGADLKKQFRQNLIDKYVNNNPLLNDIKSRFKDRAKFIGSNLLEKVTNAREKLEEAQDKKEQSEEFGIDKNNVAGNAIANMVLMGAAKMMNFGVSKIPFVKKGIVGLKELKDDPSALVRRLYDNVDGEGFFSDMARAGLSEAEYILNPRQETTKTKLQREDLNSSSSLDVRTKLSINRVIPAYLRKIHAEVKATRLKFQDDDVKSFEMSYDFNSDKFISSGSIGSKFVKDSRKLVKNRTKSSFKSMKRTLNNADYLEGIAEEDRLNSREMQKVIEALAVASTETNKTGLKLLESDNIHEKLDKNISNKLNKLTSNIRTKAEDDPDIIEDVRFGTENIRRSIPSINKYIEEMFKDGNIEELEELGLIKYDEERREYFPNEENIRMFMFATYGIKGYAPKLKDQNEDLYKFADRLSKAADNIKNGKKTDSINVRKMMSNYSEIVQAKKNVIVKEVENNTSKITKNLERSLKTMSNDTNTDSSIKESYGDAIENKDTTSGVAPEEREYPGMLGTVRKDPENFTSVRDFGFPMANKELKEKVIEDFKEEKKSQQEEKKPEQEDKPTTQIERTPKEKSGEDYVTLLKETKELHQSMELLSSAAQTNNPDMIKDAINKVNKRGHGSDSRVQAYIRQINEGMATKEKFIKGLESSLDMEKDPEGSMFKLSSILKSGYNMLPMRKTLGLVGKSLKWYIKTGWKIERWFWKKAGKKMLWDMPKGLLKMTGKAGLGLGKLGLRLGGGLTGIDTSYLVNKLDNASNRLSGRKPGEKGLFGKALSGVGLGLKGAKEASKAYIKGVRGFHKGVWNLATGKPLTEGIVNTDESKPKEKKKGKENDKLINGMTMEEYKKSKEKKKKKKGMFMTILGGMKKILFGLLGGVTFLKNFFFKKFLGFLITGLAKGLSPITSIISKSIGLLAKGATSVGGAVASAGSYVAEKASGAWNWIKNKVSGAVNKVKEIGGKVIDKVKNVFGSIGEKFAKSFPKITEGLGKFKDKVIDLIKKLKKSIFDPIVKKVGKKGAGKVVAKLAGKLASRALPLGWVLLAVDIFFIAKYYCGGLSLKSAICKGILGFDPWDDNDAVLDEDGNPVKPDKDKEEELNKEGEKGGPKESSETEKDKKESEEKKDETKKEEKLEEKNEEKEKKQATITSKGVDKITRPEVIKIIENNFKTIEDPEKMAAIGYKLTKLDPEFTSKEGYGVFNLGLGYYKTYLTNAALNVYGDKTLAVISDCSLQTYCAMLHLIGTVNSKLQVPISSVRDQWIFEFFKLGGRALPNVPYIKSEDDLYSDFLNDEDFGKETKEKTKEETKKEEETNKKENQGKETSTKPIQRMAGKRRGHSKENNIDNDDNNVSLAVSAAEIARENAGNEPKGNCAENISRALAEAGYAEPQGRPASAYQYESTGFINQYGFTKVDVGDPMSYKPQVGDISIIKPFNDHKDGHIAIYDGKNWISDHKQSSISPFKDLPKDKSKELISIYRDTTKPGSGGDVKPVSTFNEFIDKFKADKYNEFKEKFRTLSKLKEKKKEEEENTFSKIFGINKKEEPKTDLELLNVAKKTNQDQTTLISETNKKLDILINILSTKQTIVNGKPVEQKKEKETEITNIPKSNFDISRGLTERGSPIKPMSGPRR